MVCYTNIMLDIVHCLTIFEIHDIEKCQHTIMGV